MCIYIYVYRCLYVFLGGQATILTCYIPEDVLPSFWMGLLMESADL